MNEKAKIYLFNRAKEDVSRTFTGLLYGTPIAILMWTMIILIGLYVWRG